MDSVIELAVSRLASRPAERVAAEDRKEQERLDLGRRDYDVALAKRLSLIRRVVDRVGSALPPAPLPVAAPEPAPKRPGFQTGTLLATALFSAVAGAGAMWLTIGGDPRPAASPAPIAAPAPADVVNGISAARAPPPADEDQVREVIESWRAAWAGRDVDALLARYSADFTPANGQRHDLWVAARRKNISSRGDITVNTNDLKLERLDAQRMKAHFLQDYASGSYRETAQPKTLLLVRDDTGWKIVGEWQGEAPPSALAKP